ncbi:T9SS type A sorting domain-containing protein, partial [Maribellus sediminis]|uniref:T9SS type A sorting domain-containing protein n=1 Tax=Maribellus sediminis TaxID=2696285 RepID=UPI00142F4EC7
GTVTINFVIEDSCSTDNHMASFSISDAADVDVTGPGNQSYSSCDFLTDAEVTAAFNAWRDSFAVVTNECGADTMDLSGYSAPDRCTGGTVTINFVIEDSCSTDNHMASFSISDAADVDVTGPGNQSYSSCDFLTDAEVTAAFNAWRDSFAVVTNECGADTMDLSGYSAPDLCDGGTVTINFVMTDSCSADNHMASFSISARDAITVTCNDTTLQCEGSDIQGAYDAWVAGFDYQGGCVGKVQTNIAEIPTLADLPSTGGTLTFEFKAWDDCSRDSVTCTFTLPECEVCETAYGVYADSVCFLENSTGYSFSNWGWSNHLDLIASDSVILDVYAGNSSCDIITPKIGEVTVKLVGGDLSVHYMLYEGPYYMSSVHVNVNCYPFVVSKKGAVSVSPGQYTVGVTGLTYVTDYEVIIPSSKLGNIFLDNFYLIAHAVVCHIPGANESPESNSGSKTYTGGPIPCTMPTSSAQITTEVEQEFTPSELKVFPNPFSEKVTFEFVSASDAYGILDIYSLTGQRVARILDRQVIAGEMNRVTYEPDHDVSGVYLYRLDLDGDVQTGRIIYKE